MRFRFGLRALFALALVASMAACGVGPGSMRQPTTFSDIGQSVMGAPGPGYSLRNLTCSAPVPTSASVVRVVVADMGMTQMMGGVAPLGAHMMLRATPAVVPAGSVTFVVANMGWRTHEMVVLPLAPGQQPGQRTPGPDGKVPEDGSFGEASASCAQGAGDGIGSGSVGWVTLTLPKGDYELVCNLPNHYADGMYQLLTVQ